MPRSLALALPSLGLFVLFGVLGAGCAPPTDPGPVASGESAATAAPECAASRTADGWCWGMANHPNGSSRVHAFADDDAWMATGRDVVARWDGAAWKPIRTPGFVVESFWGASSRDLYAAGHVDTPNTFDDGVVLHFDGATWKKVASSPKAFHTIWGTGPSDIWAGGVGYTLLHFDGQSWTETGQIDPTLGIHYQAMDGTGPNDVWLASNTGDGRSPLRHWDGQTWTNVRFGETVLEIFAVRAFAPNDVWIGGFGELRHFDGTKWTEITAGVPASFGHNWDITSITGNAPNDMYFTLNYTNGGLGRLFHWNGSAIEEVTGVPTGDAYLPPLRAAVLGSNGTLWLTRGDNAVLQRKAQAGAGYVRTTSGPDTDFVRASASGDLVAAIGRSSHITTHGPSGWQSTQTLTPAAGVSTEPWLYGVATVAPDVVLASGAGDFVSLASGVAGTEKPWHDATTSTGGPWVSALSASDVWVSARGAVFHRINGGWAELALPFGISEVGQILAVKPNEVYLATDKGLFLYDRGEWKQKWTIAVRQIVRAADGSLWGAQANGQLVKNGALAPIADTQLAERTRWIDSLTACPDGRLYAVGPYGSMLAWNGSAWREETTGMFGKLNAVACTADNTVWAFGNGGNIAKKVH